jgi:hypothetical protein
VLPGCKEREGPFTALLTTEGTCWLYDPYPEDAGKGERIFLGCTRFYKNGTFQFLNFTKNGLQEGFRLDGEWSTTWAFSSPNRALSLGENGRQFTVVRYNRDTVFLEGRNAHPELLIRQQ